MNIAHDFRRLTIALAGLLGGMASAFALFH